MRHKVGAEKRQMGEWRRLHSAAFFIPLPHLGTLFTHNAYREPTPLWGNNP